jgi:hypothetical protein
MKVYDSEDEEEVDDESENDERYEVKGIVNSNI